MRRTPLGYAVFGICLILMFVAIWFANPYPQLFGIVILVSVIFMIWLLNKVEPRRFNLSGRKSGRSLREEVIHIPSSKLVVSSHWEKNKSDLILKVPGRVTAFIDVLTASSGHTAKAIRLERASSGLPAEKDVRKICVDGGFLFFGDQSFTEKLRQTRQMEEETLKLFEPDAQLPYALFRDEEGAKAIAVMTGEGDDWYDIETEVTQEGKYVLSARFLSDEESNLFVGVKT
jgi:hypothetical protein